MELAAIKYGQERMGGKREYPWSACHYYYHDFPKLLFFCAIRGPLSYSWLKGAIFLVDLLGARSSKLGTASGRLAVRVKSYFAYWR